MRTPHEIRILLGVCTRCGNELSVGGLLGKKCRGELRPRAINTVFHGVFNFFDRVAQDWKGHRSLDAGDNNDN